MTVNSHEKEDSTSFWRRNWQKLIALFFWIVLLGGYAWYYNQQDLTPIKAVQEVVDLLQTTYGPLLYIVLYILRPLVFFSSVVLTVTGGAVFGAGSVLNFALAILYTVIGANSSSMLAWFIGRYFGADLLKENEADSEANLVQTYAGRLRRNSFETVMIMRFIFLPYDLVSYLCGFLRIKRWLFLLATALGSIPGTIAFVAFGASLDLSKLATEGLPPPNPWVLGFGVVIFIVSIVISRYFKKREAARSIQNQDNQEQVNVFDASVN